MTLRKPLPVKDEDRLRNEWLQMEQSLLTGLCQRINLAAEAQQAAAESPLPNSSEGRREAEPPMPLHEGRTSCRDSPCVGRKTCRPTCPPAMLRRPRSSSSAFSRPPRGSKQSSTTTAMNWRRPPSMSCKTAWCCGWNRIRSTPLRDAAGP